MITQDGRENRRGVATLQPPEEHPQSEQATIPLAPAAETTGLEALSHFGERKNRTLLYTFIALLALMALGVEGYLSQKAQKAATTASPAATRTRLNDVTLYAREADVIGLNQYRELKLGMVGPEFAGKIPSDAQFYANPDRFFVDKFFAVDQVNGTAVYLKSVPEPHPVKAAEYTEVALEHLIRTAYGQGGARDWSRLEADQVRIRMTGFVIQDNGQYYLTMGNQAARLDYPERLSTADRMQLRFAADHFGRITVFGQINSTLPLVKDRQTKWQKLFTVNMHALRAR